MKTLTTIALVIGFAASLLSRAGEPTGPSLDRAKREAIIAAANQAVQKHMKGDPQERKGTEIEKKFWGKAIARLKPLRVRDDRVNVFIVLKEDETTEEGLYVSNPISSYAPGTDKRFLLFEKLTQPGDSAFGTIYRCKLRKAQAFAPQPDTRPGNSVNASNTELPKLDGESAKGLQLECRLVKTNFVVGEPVNIWCVVSNTTSSVKPIAWHPSSGCHFCCVRSSTKSFSGVLPLVIPHLFDPIMIKSQEGRPGYVLFLPSHASITLLFTYTASQPEKFAGRLVYDPLAPRGGWATTDSGEAPPWRDEWVSSNAFEYEVRAVEKK